MIDLLLSNMPEVWLFLIGFFLLYYAITDGSDLGVGIISFFSRDEDERRSLMGSIESTWHGNQTWLVILGGMLFGAFPVFYAVVLSSLYIPILIMLFGLIFRGVSFEFRKHSRSKVSWGLAFSAGSLVAALGQGFALGGLLGGLEVSDSHFVGSIWSWVNPYSFLITIGVIFGYTMLGANYLIMKTTGDLQARSYRYAMMNSLFTLGVSVAVHSWTILRYPHIAQKWIHFREFYHIAVFPLLALAAFGMLLYSLRRGREVAPIMWNALIVLCSFIGLSVEMYPVMIPQVASAGITVHAAAASTDTLVFMLVVTGILIPIILGYTAYEFWVFSGKTQEKGYPEDDEH